MRIEATILLVLQGFLFSQIAIRSALSNKQRSELINLYKNKACYKWCPSGRECTIRHDKEVCVCRTQCPSRHKPVCGSDGKLYENHCELHKKACVTKTKIHIDWGNRCKEIHGQQENEPAKDKHSNSNALPSKSTQDMKVEVFTEIPYEPMDIKDLKKKTNLFLSFGNDSIHVIDPKTLTAIKHIKASDAISGSQSTTCTGTPVRPCLWGGAVNVRNTKIYAAEGKRMLVIDVQKLTVIDVIETDRYPYKPQYVRALDEVWYSGWPTPVDVVTELEGDNGTIHVISKAAKKGQHYVTQVAYRMPIYGLHVTDTCHTQDEEKFGYVTHLEAPGFHEINLIEKEITQFINLSNYGCQGVYGFSLSVTTNHAIVLCFTSKDGGQRGQFIVDMKTKQVVAMTTVSIGLPYPSPDGRFIISLNEYMLSAVFFHQDGSIQLGEPIKTNMLLSDVAFIPRDFGYDLYVTSKDLQGILVVHVNPRGSKVLEVLHNVGNTIKGVNWAHTKREIAVGCEGHAHYLASPATVENEIVIVDAQQFEVAGKVGNISGVSTLVWVGEDDI